ncbi:hypothetical protein RBSWK_00379 [Rhodopirellula baltica SWK14]|uniref:Uncharacterized protein n=1 Tax=Rhodopirellula baltica SWK14 TaxID=993516 RepID=L7CMZ4_RHOBT|nr:hypothetical protein RBSWK_00379 [Rhodopirellula baltica SWK14]
MRRSDAGASDIERAEVVVVLDFFFATGFHLGECVSKLRMQWSELSRSILR